MSRIEVEEIAAKIRALPEIEDAIPDTPVYLHSGFGGANAKIALSLMKPPATIEWE